MHAEVEGSRLEDHQIVTEVLLLLIGGDETTRHTLSGGTRQLLQHPDQHQRLVNDLELLPNAIEEMLRWTAPVKNMARTITADNEFHGTQLHEGEKMILLFESANFDEKVFDDPETFNIERYPNNHLAFGFGTHFCLGNQLARLELSIMQTRLLQRIPDMRLASDADAAAAAGELRVRPGENAGGLHPERAVWANTRATVRPKGWPVIVCVFGSKVAMRLCAVGNKSIRRAKATSSWTRGVHSFRPVVVQRVTANRVTLPPNPSATQIA